MSLLQVPEPGPCPFCGAPGPHPTTVINLVWRVQCLPCGALGPVAASEAGAVERWNWRLADTEEARP
jgi:hypothetical protein